MQQIEHGSVPQPGDRASHPGAGQDPMPNSVYLNTLAATSRRPERTSSSSSGSRSARSRRSTSCCDTYLHGTLSTAGIAGAAPARRSLTKHMQLVLDAAARAGKLQHALSSGRQAGSSSCSGGATVQDGASGHPADPGMRPKVLIQPHTNRPDLTHSTADIQGAQPCAKDICHRPRDTNPLSPHYPLPSGTGLQFPGGPPPPDRLLRDPLQVADIPGAAPRPASPAARAAAARVAAGCRSTPGSTSRPGLLDVSDIDGTSNAWRPLHRRHVGVAVRSTALDVSDISGARCRVRQGGAEGQQGSVLPMKGHPQGPRAPSSIRPRSSPATMDNSLRLFDIEGSSVQLATRRAQHPTAARVAPEVEGARAVVRDRVARFQEKQAAAQEACAQQQAAQGVLSGLLLSTQELQLLWGACGRLDRDRSGYLTVPELCQAMQVAQLALSASDMQRLACALRDNAGLVSYKKLTRQLKGRASRPASASASAAAPAAPMSSAAAGHAGSAGQQCAQRSGPICMPAEWPATQPAPATGPGQPTQQVVAAADCGRRPSTAPAQAHSGSNSSSNNSISISRQAFRSSNVGVSGVSHWFGGSAWDREAAAGMAVWRPGQDVALLQCIAASMVHSQQEEQQPRPQQPLPGGLEQQQQASHHAGASKAVAAAAAAAAAVCGAPAFPTSSSEPVPGDVVPGWLVGADTLHGTFRVLQPFGADRAASLQPRPASAAARVAASGGERLLAATPGSRACAALKRPASAGAAGSRSGPATAAATASSGGGAWHAAGGTWGSGLLPLAHTRPASAQPGCHGGGGAVGLAERRRLLECAAQDLAAVRMLA